MSRGVTEKLTDVLAQKPGRSDISFAIKGFKILHILQLS